MEWDTTNGRYRDSGANEVREVSAYQEHGPGVWNGVMIGCGMFIVLPIIVVSLLGMLLFLFWMLVSVL